MFKSKHKALLYSYVLLLLVMFILPFFSATGYHLLCHTTSQLGAQSTPNSWVMNITFMGLGAACIYEALYHLKSEKLQQVLLIFFGMGLILSGIFKHAPIDSSVPFIKREDDLHSLASSLVGLSFTAFTFLSILITKTKRDKMLAIVVGISGTGLSFLIFNVPNYAGLFQKVMFILAFAWLLYFFSQVDYFPERKTGDKNH